MKYKAQKAVALAQRAPQLFGLYVSLNVLISFLLALLFCDQLAQFCGSLREWYFY